MKYRTSLIVILISCAYTISCFAQDKYVVTSQEQAEKIIFDLLSKQSSGNNVQDAWAKTLLTEAFNTYFTSKSTRADVYEKSFVDGLNQEIENLNDTIKKRDGIIKGLQKKASKENYQAQLDDAQRKWDSERQAMESQHNQAMQNQSDKIRMLQARVDALVADSLSFEQKISNLQEGVLVAKNVTSQYEQKKSALETLYMECKNSQTVEYIKSETVINTIKEYSDYLGILGISMPDEQKKQIDYLQVVAKVSEIYKTATSILSSKYEDASVQAWLKDFKNASNRIALLNNGQQTIMAQVEKAMSTYGSAVNHFKKSILPYLQEQGQIPDGATAKEVKEMVQIKVSNYSDGKFQDISKYSPYHINLNKVLNKTLQGIKVMNENAYNSFISNIENSL